MTTMDNLEKNNGNIVIYWKGIMPFTIITLLGPNSLLYFIFNT